MRNLSSGSQLKSKNKEYEFKLDLIDFNQPINLLKSYNESSSVWDDTTWDKVEEANPARMVLIQCLKNPQNVNLAVFDALRDKYAENFNYWLDKGICQYQQSSYPQAYFSFEFSRQFASEKQKKQIDQWIGGIYFKQGYWNKALALWSSSKLPNSYEWDSSFAHFFNGHHATSQEYFLKLVANNQINDSLILALSHIYVAGENTDKAQQMLDMVSKKGKKVRKSYFFLKAYLLKKSGNLKGLNELISDAPKDYVLELKEFAKL